MNHVNEDFGVNMALWIFFSMFIAIHILVLNVNSKLFSTFRSTVFVRKMVTSNSFSYIILHVSKFTQ